MDKTEEEIDEQVNRAWDSINDHNNGSQWPGMSYEQGVISALNWVLGNDEDEPMEA